MQKKIVGKFQKPARFFVLLFLFGEKLSEQLDESLSALLARSPVAFNSPPANE
jgi:hypothetical protein